MQVERFYLSRRYRIGRGHRRAAARRRRARAPAHHGSLARRAAVGAAVALALRVLAASWSTPTAGSSSTRTCSSARSRPTSTCSAPSSTRRSASTTRSSFSTPSSSARRTSRTWRCSRRSPSSSRSKGASSWCALPYLLDYRRRGAHLPASSPRRRGRQARAPHTRLRRRAVGGADAHAQAAAGEVRRDWPKSWPS